MGLGGAKRSRSPSDASPGAFCLLCRHGQSRSPPAGGEIPLRETTGAARRVVAPYRGRKPSHAGGHMGRPYKKKFNPRSRWRSNPPAFSQKRVSTFLGARDFKMLGGSKFRLRQGFACGKTLVRRVRAAPSAMGPRPKRRKTRVLCWNRFRSYSQIAVAK